MEFPYSILRAFLSKVKPYLSIVFDLLLFWVSRDNLCDRGNKSLAKLSNMRSPCKDSKKYLSN